MSDPNPYASPQFPSHVEPIEAEEVLPIGAWRSGTWLVMHYGATLPPFCVFTGEPAHKESLSGVPPAQLPFGIGEDQFRIKLPASCELWLLRWRMRVAYELFRWIGSALLFAAVGCFTLRASAEITLLLVGLGIAAFVCCVISESRRPTLTTDWVDSPYCWLGGASPVFLDKLEEWPYETPPELRR